MESISTMTVSVEWFLDETISKLEYFVSLQYTPTKMTSGTMKTIIFRSFIYYYGAATSFFWKFCSVALCCFFLTVTRCCNSDQPAKPEILTKKILWLLWFNLVLSLYQDWFGFYMLMAIFFIIIIAFIIIRPSHCSKIFKTFNNSIIFIWNLYESLDLWFIDYSSKNFAQQPLRHFLFDKRKMSVFCHRLFLFFRKIYAIMSEQ